MSVRAKHSTSFYSRTMPRQAQPRPRAAPAPRAFFDAADQMPATLLLMTSTQGLVSKTEELHDSPKTLAAGISVNIEDCRGSQGLGIQGREEAKGLSQELPTEMGIPCDANGGAVKTGCPETSPRETQKDQKPRARRFLTEFIPQKQVGSNLREETRKIVQMLSNDKVCKIDRPSLGLQDRLQSLVQRLAGKRTSYVKGPRVCSTLVKSIVKKTQDSSSFRRTSFQGYHNKQDEKFPLPIFIKPIPSYIKALGYRKVYEGDDTPMRAIQISNHENSVSGFEMIIRHRKKDTSNIPSDTTAGTPAPVLTYPSEPLADAPHVTLHNTPSVTYITHDTNTPPIVPNHTSHVIHHNHRDTQIEDKMKENADTGEIMRVSGIVDSARSTSGVEENFIDDELMICVPYESEDLDTQEPTCHRPSFPDALAKNPAKVSVHPEDEMEISSEKPPPNTHSCHAEHNQATKPYTKETVELLQNLANTQLNTRETSVTSQNFRDKQYKTPSTNITNGHNEKLDFLSPTSRNKAPQASRLRGDSMTNGLNDLGKHIASLNKVPLTCNVKNTGQKNDKDTTAPDDSPALPPKTQPKASEANHKVLQVTERETGESTRKSSMPNNEANFCFPTAIANLSMPLYSEAMQRRLSPTSTSRSFQRSLSTREIYKDEETTSNRSALHIDTLMRLKTDNLVARYGGKRKPMHPYPTSPRQTTPTPAADIPDLHKPVQKITVCESGIDSTDCTLSLSAQSELMESVPPIPLNVLKAKRECASHQASKDDTGPASPPVSPRVSLTNGRHSRTSSNRIRSGNATLEQPCPGSRRDSHIIQRPGSRRGSKKPSFCQDTLRKCLIAAVDQCYNTEWEETCDSNVMKYNTLSQEQLNMSLVKAISRQDTEKVRVLLTLGADPNVKWGNTPALLRAAREGALYVMQALLAAGADVDVRSDMGNSPLHLAARSGYSEVAIQLVHSGAFVDAINRSGVTPLQMALAHGHLEVARSLLRLNADMFIQNKVGETAYDVANELGYIGLCATPLEIRRDSGVGTRVAPTSNAVPMAVRMIQGIEVGCAGTVDDCLREGASPNTLLPLALHWPARASVLHRAAHHGHDLIVRLLLAAGADIEGRDVVGNTPLHVAAQAGHNRVVKILLDRGAPLEAVSQSGMSPMHRAASKGKELTCNLLLRRGGNIRAEDTSGKTPADWARKRGFKHLSHQLMYRRKSSDELLAEGKGRLALQHLHHLHEAALKAPQVS